MSQLAIINLRAGWRRVLLLLPVAAVLVGAWFVVRWHVGNTMASPAVAPDIGMAQAAVRLAPDDPQTHFTLGRLGVRSFLPEDLAEALRRLEQATALSPHDFRLWMDLGRERERAGDSAGGERALRRAAELAPHYADPRWYLGNLLLREGRYDEAFAELRLAGERHPQRFRAQVFNMAWQVFGGDLERVAAAVGDAPEARAALSQYLMGLGRKDEALSVWASLSGEAKREQRAAGEALLQSLFAAKQYRAALNIHRELASEGTPQPAVGQLLNGSFEEEIAPPGRSLFGWQVAQEPHARIHLDPQGAQAGGRSLRVTFNAPEAFEWRNVSQFVVVEPQTQYRLQYAVRTADLRGIAAPVAQVADAAEPGRVLAVSGALPEGTSDWQTVTLEFTTPAQTEGVTLRLERGPCPYAACPLFGRVWYDNFSLQRVGGNGRETAGGSARR